MTHKPGWRTSEFWGLILSLVLAAALIYAGHHWSAVLLPLASSVYSVCRTILKNPTLLVVWRVLKFFTPGCRSAGATNMSAVPSTTPTDFTNPVADAAKLASLIEKTDLHAQALLGKAVLAVGVYGVYKAAKLVAKSVPSFAAVVTAIETTVETAANPPTTV